MTSSLNPLERGDARPGDMIMEQQSALTLNALRRSGVMEGDRAERQNENRWDWNDRLSGRERTSRHLEPLPTQAPLESCQVYFANAGDLSRLQSVRNRFSLPPSEIGS